MLKDILLYIITGIAVLGSVFGATHIRKLARKVQQVLGDRKLLKDQHRPVQSKPAAPEDSRVA
jgi:hypothetical protein